MKENKKPFFILGQCAKMLFPLASHSKRQCEESAQFNVDLEETDPGKMAFAPLCTKHGIEIAVQKFVHHHINAFPSFLTDKEIAKMLEIETNPAYISKLAEAQNGLVRVAYYKGDLFWEDIVTAESAYYKCPKCENGQMKLKIEGYSTMDVHPVLYRHECGCGYSTMMHTFEDSKGSFGWSEDSDNWGKPVQRSWDEAAE